jgi:acetyl esterase/lipase
MASPAAQRAIANLILSLPAPLLRLMSGGGVVHVGGRTLDPRLQFLAAQARKQPAMTQATPEQARAGMSGLIGAVAGKPEPGVACEDLDVQGASGDIPARAYRPANQDPDAPLMVWAHMGGGVIGDIETTHVFCTVLAKITRGPVLSIDYRLAPEHRYPAGIDDTLAAYRWAREHSTRFGAPAGKVAMGGDSMGGNFTAIVCQELKRVGEPQPVLQLLVYPCTDVASQTPSMTTYGEAFPLTSATMDWFMGHYLNPGDDPAHPKLSPLKEADLSGLAPAVIATAGFDPLVDQGEAYAKALREAGVPVAYRCYDSLAHAFVAFTGAVPAADAASREVARLVRQGYEGRLP